MSFRFTLPTFIVPVFYATLSIMDLFSLTLAWVFYNPSAYTLVISALYQALLLWFFSRSVKRSREIELFSLSGIMLGMYGYVVLYAFPYFVYATVCTVVYGGGTIQVRSFSSLLIIFLFALLTRKVE